jgi:hypothetical protein
VSLHLGVGEVRRVLKALAPPMKYGKVKLGLEKQLGGPR